MARVVAGRYRLIRRLGTGGAGEVFEVEHLQTGVHHALKLLGPAARADHGMRARFIAEGRTLAALESDYVVRVNDVGTLDDDGEPFMLMELLDGVPLEEYLNEPLSPGHALELLTQMARGLSRVHALGFAHCDLKPDNIVVMKRADGSTHVELIDFGISERIGAASADEPREVFGTPPYMAPEQALGARSSIDERTDTWALAMVAFRMLYGRPYFSSEQGPLTILMRLAFESLSAPSQVSGHSSPAFDAWFQRSCSRDSEDRFRCPERQIRALSAALDGVHSPFPATDAPERRTSVGTRRFSHSRELAELRVRRCSRSRPLRAASKPWHEGTVPFLPEATVVLKPPLRRQRRARSRLAALMLAATISVAAIAPASAAAQPRGWPSPCAASEEARR